MSGCLRKDVISNVALVIPAIMYKALNSRWQLLYSQIQMRPIHDYAKPSCISIVENMKILPRDIKSDKTSIIGCNRMQYYNHTINHHTITG